MNIPIPRSVSWSTSRSVPRGFTLVELMAVVLIIAVLAAIAVPGAASMIKERRSASAATLILQHYRTARARAMGRGSAVLVRYESGRVRVREAIVGSEGTSAGCNLVPATSCSMPAGRWDDDTLYRELDEFNPAGSTYENVAFQFIEYTAASSTPQTFADICFTPGGRAFYRTTAATSPFIELTSAAAIRVRMEYGGEAAGVERHVYVLPNGMARLAL